MNALLAITLMAGATPASFGDFIAQADYDCTTMAANVAATRLEGVVPEAQRIRQLLDSCSRPRDPERRESYLYTWGYKDKLAKMLSMSRMEYCAYDHARLQTFLALKNTTDGKMPEPLPFMETALDNITRSFIEIPSLSYYDEIVGVSEADFKQTIETGKAECNGAVCRAHYDGRLDGLAQSKRATFSNTSTFGLGVSFANNPLEAIDFLADENHRGIVCNINNDTTAIADLYSGANNNLLEAKNIKLNQNKPGKDFVANMALLPFYNPVAFEHATHNRIMRVNSNLPVYLDKCHIEYQTSCQYIAVENLSDCPTLWFLSELFDNLLDDPDMYGPDAGEKEYLDGTNIKVENVKKLGRYLVEQSSQAPDTRTVQATLRERWLMLCGLPQDHGSSSFPETD